MRPPTLLYRDGQDVRLGDRIRIARLLRSPFEATVSYITGFSQANALLEYENDGLVTVAASVEGTLRSWSRRPGEALPGGITLISRAAS